MCGIYKVTNKINGKIYVGKSIDIKNRWSRHISESLVSEKLWKENYRHIRTPFHSAIRKYGEENFNWEVIEECPRDQLNDREKYWIKELFSNDRNVGYNVTMGGDGYSCGGGENAPGCKISLEESQLIKQKLKERWTYKQIQELVPQISISAMCSINYGETWFDEKESYPISINNGHRIWSDKEAMAIKNRYSQGDTINDLAIEFGVSQETISNLVRGKSYANLPVIKRDVGWKRINKNRKFSEQEVLFYRKEFYQNGKSIKSLHESCNIKCNYAAFYNMIKGNTYKNIGGLPK